MTEELDLIQSTCEVCKNHFYTDYIDELKDSPLIDPNYCPFCGVQFTTKNGEPKQ
jgi:hypothetical protein